VPDPKGVRAGPLAFAEVTGTSSPTLAAYEREPLAAVDAFDVLSGSV